MAQFTLDRGYRMHQTSLDIENAAIIRRMYGGYNRRGPWFYSENPYALSGLGWLGLGAQTHGVELEWCNQTTVQDQYECSERNQNAINASYVEHPGSYLGNGIYAGTPEAVAMYGGGQVAWDLPGPTPVSAYLQPPPLTPAPPPQISQAQASAITGQPNQNVPPQNPLTPMGSGISNTGQQIRQGMDQAAPPAEDKTWMYVAIAAGALLFLSGRK